MASKLEQVWALLKTQLVDNTTIDALSIGRPVETTKGCGAELWPGGGDASEQVGTLGHYTDWTGGFTLRIKAGSTESAQNAAEEALQLWRGVAAGPTALRAALAAVGVTQFPKSESLDPPVIRPGGKQLVIVDLDFQLTVRWLK